ERRLRRGCIPPFRVNPAGGRIEPPVSVPVAPRHSFAATAAAEPPDEPPGVNGVFDPFRRHGECTGPKCDVSLDEPIANSSQLVLPRSTAPSRQSWDVTVDSYVGTKLSRICEHAVERMPAVQNMSLMASGIPSSGPASPDAIRPSDFFAMAAARSGVSRTNALRGRAFSIAETYAAVNSLAEKDFFFSPSRASAKLNDVNSVTVLAHPPLVAQAVTD